MADKKIKNSSKKDIAEETALEQKAAVEDIDTIAPTEEEVIAVVEADEIVEELETPENAAAEVFEELIEEDFSAEGAQSEASRAKQNGNEIDDFAKALLSKKTHMALYPEEQPEKEEEPVMSQEEKLEAASHMASALDRLRQERGQVPIDQEEEDYQWNQAVSFTDRFASLNGEEDDNFTTASLFGKSQEPAGIYEDQETHYETKPKKDKTKHLVSQEQRPASRKKPHRLRKQAKILIGCVIAVLLLLFAGYVYKVKVYDPANVITEEQETIIKNFKSYADEYDMLSDAEKNELLDLQSDYDKLSTKQKSELDSYFQEQTGSTLTDIMAALKEADKNSQSETDEAYVSLQDYVSGYASYDESQKLAIVDWIATYNGLSNYLQGKINDTMNEQAGVDFLTAYNEAQATLSQAGAQEDDEGEAAANTEDSAESLAAQYQSAIDSLTYDRNNYQEFLEQEGMSTDGDETLAQYDAQISYYQSLLNSLQ